MGTVDNTGDSCLAYTALHIYISTGEGPLGEDDQHFSWLFYILNQTDELPMTSTSHFDHEKSNWQDYAKTAVNLFAQLGAHGVHVLFPSGRWGVGEGSPRDLWRKPVHPRLPYNLYV
jgi:hypothetical protein